MVQYLAHSLVNSLMHCMVYSLVLYLVQSTTHSLVQSPTRSNPLSGPLWSTLIHFLMIKLCSHPPPIPIWECFLRAQSLSQINNIINMYYKSQNSRQHHKPTRRRKHMEIVVGQGGCVLCTTHVFFSVSRLYSRPIIFRVNIQ